MVDKNPKLKIGDKIHYWVFAQNNRLGFDREDQVFEVTQFFKEDDNCDASISKYDNDQSLCKNEIIFEDNFRSAKINDNIWDVLQYIPTYLEDVSYTLNSRDFLFTLFYFVPGWRILFL